MNNWKFVRLFIAPSNQCQFKCSFCFSPNTEKGATHMDIELAKAFLRDFGRYAKACNITGLPGNPVLYNNLDSLVRMCKRVAKNVSINCRGKISEESLQLFKTFNMVVYYSIDWYGKFNDIECNMTGLWEQQKKMLERMGNEGLKIAIRTTIMRENYSDCLQLMNMVAHLRKQGANVVWEAMPYLPYHGMQHVPTMKQMENIVTTAMNKDYTRIVIPGWTCIYPNHRDRASRWWHQQERLCESGRDYGRIALKHTGEILPCPFETESMGKYEKIGGIWDIDHGKVNYNLENYLIDTGRYVDEKCKKCIFYDACGGGCRTISRIKKEDENVYQPCPIPSLYGTKEEKG